MPTSNGRTAGGFNAEQLRDRVAGALHCGIAMATSASSEMANLLGEQAEFAGRVVERSIDCAFGPHAARSPEAMAATGRTLVSDCLDNAVAVAERVMRVGTATMERMQECAGVSMDARPDAGACCGGAAKAEPVGDKAAKSAR
ncbi:MAG TPA: hypothetical protein PKC43_09705 [Phycisphaerales bacterium]|nr:hypothetical protein [Phycisphaerales bacterium]HMP37709.1 hypothetical protein [Phycisphaerales bacterium]